MEKKITKKLLAILMIITLLATDFYVLGSGLISYAADSSNVEISAYFKDDEGRKVYKVDKSIKDENVKLYVDVRVNSGYFIGKEITVQDGNFNIKSSNNIQFSQINAGETATLELDIEPIIKDEISVDMLSKASTVVLTGNYTNSNSKSELETETISVTDEITMNYQPDATIANAELETDIVTNKVLSVNGTNKRVVQALVKSRLTENQYPVEYTKLNVAIPQLGKEEPEVSVIALGKLATNGKTEINNSDYTIIGQNLEITLKNEADENGQIRWMKDACDELVITFMYEEDVDVSTAKIKTDLEMKLYNTANTYTATYTKGIENQGLNNVVMGRTEITTEELYKGQLYVNSTSTKKVNIPYQTKTTLGITNTGVTNQIIVHEGNDIFGTESQELEANTRYVSTEIDRDSMLALFGDSATIEIKNGDKVKTIKVEDANANGKIVVTYPTDVREIDIVITGNPISTGILEINHVKEITENNYTRTELQDVKTLNTKGTILAKLDETKILENPTEINESSLELKETVSRAELTVDKGNLSTTEVNEVTLGVKLINDGLIYDLYKNPTIEIQLPASVESVEVTGMNKLYGDELRTSVAQYRPSTKTIFIKLEGEQTAYPESSATQLYLQIRLNIKLSKLVATQTDEITMTYTNENATQYYGGTTDVGTTKCAIGISAPTGLMKMFNLSLNENTSLSEAITQLITDEDAGKTFNFETILVNNIGTDMNNVRILGKLPTTRDAENTLETTLTSVSAPNAITYYTENANATSDVENAANGWTTNLAELTNAKLYMIKLDTLSKANNYTLSANIKIPNAIPENALSSTEYEVIYDTETDTNINEASRKIVLITSAAAALETTLTAQVGGDILNNYDVVKEGEVIKYTATAKNNGTDTLENLELKADIPDGTVLVEPMEMYEYEDGYYVEKADREVVKTFNINPGQTYTLQYEVRVNTEITEGTEISNKAILKYNETEQESNEIKNKLAKSDIRTTIKRAEEKTYQWVPGGDCVYEAYVENLSNTDISNLKIKIISDNIRVTSIEKANGDFEFGEDITETNIDEIPKNGKTKIVIKGVIKEKVEKLAVYVSVIDSNQNIYRSNELTEVLPYADFEIKLTSPQNNKYIALGDMVEYNIDVENVGDIDGYVSIMDKIPEYFKVREYYINGKLSKQTIDETDQQTYLPKIDNVILEGVSLKVGEKIQLKIKAEVYDIPTEEILNVTNKASIMFLSVTKWSAETVHILRDLSLVQEVSGHVWLDENENSQQDEGEKALEGIVIKLYDSLENKYLTNENGTIEQAITNNLGEFKFSNIYKGTYIIVAECDMSKYEPTTGSNVKIQDLYIGGETKTVIGTEAVSIQNNVTDINIELKEISDPTQPGNPDKPGNPDEPEGPAIKKSISGLAWLDEDRDGQKDSNEKVLSGIRVRLYTVSTQNYLKDVDGNIIEVTTDTDGKYIFDNIEKGSYIVLFEYDKEKYEPTVYMAENVDTTKNSKAITKKININGEELIFAVTDTINLQEDIKDVNIGLKENLIFDLELNKYISKIVVQNNKGSKSYDYDNGKIGKVEIHKKQFQGSLVVLEYKIKVKNNGEMAGYVKNIVDYLPSGLTFSSELNNDWYLSGEYLYTKSLENVELKPGEEKELKLILTKTMTSENVGLINNRAEIYQDYNKYGDSDIDSTPNNQVPGEDDMGAVDVIIGIATGGSTIAYIILLMINILLIAAAIKLMIKNGIINIPTKKERR